MGLWKSKKRTQEQANSGPGLSIEDPHMLGNIGHATKIEQSERKTVQDRQDTRSSPFTNLAMVFAQGHIPPMVQPILNMPMLSLQTQQIVSGCESHGEIAQAMDHLLMRFPFSLNRATQLKHLGHSGPGRGQKLIELGGGNQFTPFEAAMPFVPGLRRSPISAIGGRFTEKQ